MQNYKFEDAENIEFCEIRLEKFSNTSIPFSGVYLWIVDNKIKYVGETIDMKKRFNNGYGHISPRNIFKGGQSTNCKMNKFALNMFNQGKDINIYFHEASKNDRENIEKNILDYYKKTKKIKLLNAQNN